MKIFWIVCSALLLCSVVVTDTVQAFDQSELDRFLATNECLGCDLRGAFLADKNFSKAKLEGTDLRDADLRGANLRMADMANTDLRGTDLSFTILEAADLYQAKIPTIGICFGHQLIAEALGGKVEKASDD